MTVLVTGASGKLGRLVIDALIERGVAPDQIRAGARRPDSLADAAARGVVVVPLDYDAPETVSAAIEGVERVLLISGNAFGRRAAQHQVVIDAAASAGVEQFVYTSTPRADSSGLVVAPEHKATEEAIRAAGLPATILRNGWYTENYAARLDAARATGEVVESAGEGRVASASRRDYAEAAAVVLTESGHVGATYELSGDVAWDFDEFAAVAGSLVGRPVTHVKVSPAEHEQRLLAAGIEAGTAGFMLAVSANTRDGWLEETSGDLARLIGRPTTPLAEGLVA